jgi:hypothetical protein
MIVNDLDTAEIKNICTALASGFHGTLKWAWDRRFETVLAEFGVDRKDDIRATLEQSLKVTWDSANVGNAPEIVRAIDDLLGGLRPGQFLFTSDPQRDALIFCAWWPWGSGREISLRVGPSYKNLSDSERADSLQQFKGWFGV